MPALQERKGTSPAGTHFIQLHPFFKNTQAKNQILVHAGKLTPKRPIPITVLKHISEFKDQAPVSIAGAMPKHSGSQVKDSLLISSLFPDSSILLYFSGALHTSDTLISSESLIIAITGGGVSMRMNRIGPQRV